MRTIRYEVLKTTRRKKKIFSEVVVLNEHHVWLSNRVSLRQWLIFFDFFERFGEWLNNEYLTAEAVEGAALALERVDDIHGGDRLSASVLGVGHGVTDDVLEEHLEDASGLFVDETRDALDTTTACETADRRLRDPLDVITEDLAVTLSAALPKTFTTFTTTRHCCCCLT